MSSVHARFEPSLLMALKELNGICCFGIQGTCLKWKKSRYRPSSYIPVTHTTDKSLVHIFQVKLNIIGGISSNEPVLGKSIDIDDRTVFDLKFVDDENIMLLCYSASRCPRRSSTELSTKQAFRIWTTCCLMFLPDYP